MGKNHGKSLWFPVIFPLKPIHLLQEKQEKKNVVTCAAARAGHEFVPEVILVQFSLSADGKVTNESKLILGVGSGDGGCPGFFGRVPSGKHTKTMENYHVQYW